MATATLKSRIDKLINDLGGNPKPGPVDIRNRLATFASLAEALESGQSAIEAEEKITVLEATIKELEANLRRAESKLESANMQGQQLQSSLDAARDDIRRARKQKEESEPLSTIETRILNWMDVNGPTFEEAISKQMQVLNGTKTILAGLVEAGFVTTTEEPGEGAPHYFLTKKAKAWIEMDRLKGPF